VDGKRTRGWWLTRLELALAIVAVLLADHVSHSLQFPTMSSGTETDQERWPMDPIVAIVAIVGVLAIVAALAITGVAIWQHLRAGRQIP
jgi:hypothetical protein